MFIALSYVVVLFFYDPVLSLYIALEFGQTKIHWSLSARYPQSKIDERERDGGKGG